MAPCMGRRRAGAALLAPGARRRSVHVPGCHPPRTHPAINASTLPPCRLQLPRPSGLLQFVGVGPALPPAHRLRPRAAAGLYRRLPPVFKLLPPVSHSHLALSHWARVGPAVCERGRGPRSAGRAAPCGAPHASSMLYPSCLNPSPCFFLSAGGDQQLVPARPAGRLQLEQPAGKQLGAVGCSWVQLDAAGLWARLQGLYHVACWPAFFIRFGCHSFAGAVPPGRGAGRS